MSVHPMTFYQFLKLGELCPFDNSSKGQLRPLNYWRTSERSLIFYYSDLHKSIKYFLTKQ